MSKLLKHLKDAKGQLQQGSTSEGMYLLDDAIKAYEQQLESTQDIVNVQCNDGNWNCDSYMHGMANGMLVVQSMFTDRDPVFLEAPEIWLSDSESESAPTESLAEITPK